MLDGSVGSPRRGRLVLPFLRYIQFDNLGRTGFTVVEKLKRYLADDYTQEKANQHGYHAHAEEQPNVSFLALLAQ